MAAAVVGLLVPVAASAFDPYLETPEASVTERTPAFRHANLSADAAYAELQARGILFQREPPTPGVLAPIRLTGRLHGVHVHSALPEAQRVRTPFEICDARLALALDDFAELLARHDIDEVVHYSMYRPYASGQPRPHLPAALPGTGALPMLPLPDAASGGLAPVTVGSRSVKQQGGPVARAPTSRVAQGTGLRVRSHAPERALAASPVASRHPAGLAIDVAKLHKRSGQWLDVAAHFGGRIGARTCGAGAAVPMEDRAKELRAIVCEANAQKVFTYVLTPNYNAAHRDHFHMEVKSGARWFLYH